MPQSLARVLIHLVFSTKNREAFIPEQMRPRLHAYIAGTINRIQCTSVQVGGTADHAHALLALGRTITIASVVEELKTGSSKWAKIQGMAGFAWQAGYGAFSESESKAQDVVHYVRRQLEHHRNRTFQEEYREFLVRHGIEFDERYVWD